MKRFMNQSWWLGGSLIVAGVLLSGCPKKGTVPVEVPETPVKVSTGPVSGLPIDGQIPSVSVDVGTDWTAAPGILETIYFDYMAAELTDAARASLKQNAVTLKAILKAAPGVKIRVEGHCDERGTLEYNMALGERRANAVRNYYVSLGVSKSALSTVSYGEERPACRESTEGCYTQNRRGETVLRSTTGAVKVPVAK